MILREGYEDWKIYPLYEVFYIDRILSATDSAIASWESIDSLLASPEMSTIEAVQRANTTIIRHCDNIVHQAGVISRYFFPTKNRDKDSNTIHQLRGEKLRNSYEIPTNSVLKERGFRNHMEHFDENLDAFLNNTVAGNIFPSAVFIQRNHIDSITHVFKAYVINENMFVSLGKEIHLAPLLNELYRIHNLCLDFLKNGSRLKNND